MIFVGIGCLIVAFAWGCFNYHYYKTEGATGQKALFQGLASGVNIFLALMMFMRSVNGTPGSSGIHDYPEINIANNIDQTDSNGSVIPWIIGAIGIGILAPEILPFFLGGM